ncbi:cytokinin hydroxylase-like [Rhodamnia argentea]|uniref:Cytokinin hydroxylase-like n=1 Tax=Rhodamnia argentea TaxID=178133 RepID=A0A8B8P6T9_9MYRT|nr:cytokinin hydroxylase-like [Rhodamnia argentea]
MEYSLQASNLALSTLIVLLLSVLWRVAFRCWISPARAYQKLKRNGLRGPSPTFPLGNLMDMKKAIQDESCSVNSSDESSKIISHDKHSTVLPYFARWQKSHGKVFMYWLGTEPFLYIAEPEFLKQMSSGVMGKSWGKPRVFKNDREPMFGNGLVMTEGDEWVRHRHLITPAFSPANLKGMASLMVESANKMLEKWTALVNSGNPEIDIEREIVSTAGEIIAKTSFGISHEDGKKVFEKLQAMQVTLFKTNRFVGVPFNQFIAPKKSMEAKRLGKEIDDLLMSIINDRKAGIGANNRKDLLGLLLEGNSGNGRTGKSLTTRELVDECKTFFFGGHETTALALSWTLLLLAIHPEWQDQLRDEIKQVVGDNKEIDSTKMAGLKKMGWVMNEVLRLYSPSPNVQRQALEDIKVYDKVIPKGTNMWIDVVSMNHDPTLWGDDVNQFKPERFKEDSLYGGCKHKMGFLPFGFGGRMCIGRNLTMMEYKIVLTLILSKFSFSVSPSYCHSPSVMLSLRPSQGLPLIVKPL